MPQTQPTFTDIVAIDELKKLCEAFSEATGFTTGLVDQASNEVLIATGWRDICTKFHRKNPASLEYCKASNQELTANLNTPGKVNICHCQNGLVDGSTPIIIEGHHYANLFTGQVFFSRPDRERFKNQAIHYGYDQQSYLDAMTATPVVSEEKFTGMLRFLSQLASTIGEIGLANLKSQRKAEEEKLNQQAFLASIIDSIPDLFFWKDINMEYLGCNDAFAKLTGLAGKDIIGRSDLDLFPMEIADSFRQQDKEVLAAGKANRKQEEVTCPDGSNLFFDTLKTPRLGPKGEIIGVIGVSRDISKLRETEVQLTLSEEKFRTMADFSHDWEKWTLPDGEYAYNSPSCERITGYTPSEFTTNPDLLVEIVHPDDRQIMAAHQAQHLNPKADSAELEFRIITKSGQTRWIWHKCSAVFKQDGTWMGRRVSNRDITDKHEAETMLQQERDMFLHGPVATFTWKNLENWPVEQVSANIRDITGYKAEDFLNGSVHYSQCVHPDDYDRVMAEVTTHSDSGADSFIHQPYRLVSSSNTSVWVLDTTTIIRDNKGKITHYLGYIVDISEQKRQEQIILENSKQQEELKRLESLKTMAGAIAHRFNNSMMAVLGNLDLITMTLPHASDEQQMAADALQAARGASQVGSMMLSTLLLKVCNKKQEIQAAIFIKSSIDAAQNALTMLINRTPLSVT